MDEKTATVAEPPWMVHFRMGSGRSPVVVIVELALDEAGNVQRLTAAPARGCSDLQCAQAAFNAGLHTMPQRQVNP